MRTRLTSLLLCLFLGAPLLAAGDTVEDLLQQVDQTLVTGYLQDLVAFGPRVTGTTACYQAGDYIYDAFDNMGLDASLHPWSYGGYSGNNVVATIHDSGGPADEVFIVCAHYDSVTGSPGADDNASGTASVMALADVFSHYAFDCEIRFVAFSGEEQGLLGSYVYAQQVFNNGDPIVGVINADMIGYALTAEHETKIKVYHDTASQWLVDLTNLASRRYDAFIDLEVIPSGYSYGSDHYSFWNYGFNAVFYHEYKFNDYYHSSQDTIAKMNLGYLTRCCRLMAASLAELSHSFDPLPLLADRYTLSYRNGGQIDFSLDAGAGNAGRYYLMLGSVSGTSPGLPLPGGLATLPLNWDGFTDFMVLRLNTALFDQFLGTLDGFGRASAHLDTGPLPPKWLGRVMHYAYCLEGTPDWDFASNPAAVEVVP